MRVELKGVRAGRWHEFAKGCVLKTDITRRECCNVRAVGIVVCTEAGHRCGTFAGNGKLAR